MAKFPIRFESVGQLAIERLQVPGGWLVRTINADQSLVYVPDAKSEWDLEVKSPRDTKRREA